MKTSTSSAFANDERLISPIWAAIIVLCCFQPLACTSEPGSIFGDGAEYSDRYDPEEVEATWRRKAQTHRIDPSYSLSGDGKVSSSLITGSARNSVFMRNYETNSVVQFVLNAPEGVLLDPDISDDASKIAIVRSEIDAPYTFLSDIIIINTDGEVIDTIGECNGLYRQPAFSPDGNKIAYLKFANNGNPGDIPSERGGRASTIWLPYEFDLVTREERRLVELAWRVGGWIEYVEKGQEFALRVSDVQTVEKKVTAAGRPFQHWRGMGGTSILDDLSEADRSDLLWPQIVGVDPEALDPTEKIYPALKTRTEFSVIGASGSNYIAQRNPTNDLENVELLILDTDFGIRSVISRDKPFVHEAAISRDGCVVMEGRRPRNSQKVKVYIWNVCDGSVSSFPEAQSSPTAITIREGTWKNEC